MGETFSDMIESSARGSLVLILGQMTSTLINALGVIIVARLLGASSYGLIAIAIIPINIAMLLINNGVSNALTNFIAEDRHLRAGENVHSIVLTGLIINTVAGFLTFLTLYLSAGYLATKIFMRPELTPLIRILSSTTLSLALFNTSGSILVGFEQMSHRSLLNVTYSLLKSIIGPVLVYLGYGLAGAAIGSSAPILLAGLTGLLLIVLNLKQVDFRDFDSSYFKPIIRYSAPIFVSALLSGVFLQALNFILPLYASASAIGSLGAATNFTVLISFFLAPISMAMFPLLSKLNPEDNVFLGVYRNIIKYESIVAFPVAALVIALSSNLVNILYGSDYQSAILYVKIIMLNYLFLGLGSSVNDILLNSQKRTDIKLRTTLLHLLVGIPLGFILIPRYGVLGFQATALLAPKLGLLYTILWIRENLGVTFDLVSTAKITLSALLGYLGCVFTLRLFELNDWLELVLGGVVLAGIYILSILLTGALTRDNLSDIKRITDKNRLVKPIADSILELLAKIARS